jgi:hypothetical protein
MSKAKEVKYRVFDTNGNYQQSYSGQLSGAFNWAKECAKRVNGYIIELVSENGIESSSEVVLDLRNK